jgi:25S rRNA (adenine2142-N1)-methyltransferase
MAKKRKPHPITPPPHSILRSRKYARQVTTLFHKYSQKRDEAIARARAGGCIVDEDVAGAREGECKFEDDLSLNRHASIIARRNSDSSSQISLLNEVKKWNDKLSEIGGREVYQRASQLNTSLFSTSKWVLGVLRRWGWLDGLPVDDGKSPQYDNRSPESHQSKKIKRNLIRRDVRLLEIGAINTQLLDAADRTRVQKVKPKGDNKVPPVGFTENLQINNGQRVYRLQVHAIDILSTDPRIQQIDFFQYPLPDVNEGIPSAEHLTTSSSAQRKLPYDVLVNSMVLNCVTSPEQRGHMLHLCYQHLHPGGILFLVLPKLCLKQSKFMTYKYFEQILRQGVGFEILDEVAKDSPKLAFFILRRPENDTNTEKKWNDNFERMRVLKSGKKFRNSFAILLSKEELSRGKITSK